PDSTPWPIERVMLPHEYDELQSRLRAAEDSARADSLARAARAEGDSAAADTAGAGNIVTRAATPRLPPAQQEAAADSATGPLPSRELVIIPARPLRAAARFLVELGGIVNING